MTREKIIDAANVAAREHGWSPERADIVYDENNTLLNFFIPPLRELEGRDYRTVIYRGRGRRPQRDLWIPIDECTGEALTVLETPRFTGSHEAVRAQATPERPRTQDSRNQTNAGKHILSREQITHAAKVAAKQHSWDPDKSYIIYDEGNAIWRFYWPIHDRELEGRNYQAIIFRRREPIPGGELFVVVDGQTGEVLTIQRGR